MEEGAEALLLESQRDCAFAIRTLYHASRTLSGDKNTGREMADTLLRFAYSTVGGPIGKFLGPAKRPLGMRRYDGERIGEHRSGRPF